MKVTPNKDVKNGDDEAIYIRLGDVPLDMMRYNISMQSGSERKETRKALLLKLGAKKPKNAYVNYKELMQSRAKAKKEAEMYPFDRAANFVNKKRPLKKLKKRDKKKRKIKLKKKMSKPMKKR
ncbi:unnamed protein product [Heterobilharzia americana]|nr:unnamed protein product [Heterobilharzia americana]CAH8445579.1 unnamed protein product [Heterobilharzia americana]